MKTNEIAGVGNHYDFRFRGYDPRLGRFQSVDPLAPKYSWNSTYAFAENDPINYTDLEGAEKTPVKASATTNKTSPQVKINTAGMVHLTYSSCHDATLKIPDFSNSESFDHWLQNSGHPLKVAAKAVEQTIYLIPFIGEIKAWKDIADGLKPFSGSQSSGVSSGNKLTPYEPAPGEEVYNHTTFKRGNDGRVYKYETYEKTRTGHWNPAERYDGGMPDGSAGAPQQTNRS